jgi:NAD(P)-dependent dehydrogenase (short-subunit alcohol dehydrogenase family)
MAQPEGSAGPGVVLITGASAGIGLVTADHLAGRGWTVIGASRRGTGSTGWTPLVMDVDDDASVRTGVEGVVTQHGRLTAVVACAGWGLSGPVEQTPIDEAKRQLETNFWGAVRVVQAALPAMRRQGSGRVVLVSSIGGVVALPFQAFYSASKFALEGYGEALAYEVAPFGIDVTLVEPGNVRTEFTARRHKVVPLAEGGPVEEAGAADPYEAMVAKSVGLMERDEANGVPAADVARVITRVLESRRPPRHVSVGKMGERVGIMAKRLMPYRWFEQAAKGSLGVEPSSRRRWGRPGGRTAC